MKEYTYQLEKYKGRDSRFTCPECKTKNEFAKYQNIETGEYLSSDVGRCNREGKCGYHYTPKQFFKDNNQSYTPMIKVIPKPIRPIEFMTNEVMIKSLKTENNFIKYLSSLFDTKDVVKTVEQYNLGDDKDGKVIFWQIDRQNRIRTGKAMQYNPKTGKRDKGAGAVSWMHEKSFNFKQCLYGFHLFDENKTTAVVESEKTAVMSSLIMPQFTWMATGGLQNTKLIDDLKGCDVILFPDLGRGFIQWNEYAKLNGFKVSSYIEKRASDVDKQNGLDIVDYLLKQHALKNIA